MGNPAHPPSARQVAIWAERQRTMKKTRQVVLLRQLNRDGTAIEETASERMVYLFADGHMEINWRSRHKEVRLVDGQLVAIFR